MQVDVDGDLTGEVVENFADGHCFVEYSVHRDHVVFVHADWCEVAVEGLVGQAVSYGFGSEEWAVAASSLFAKI